VNEKVPAGYPALTFRIVFLCTLASSVATDSAAQARAAAPARNVHAAARGKAEAVAPQHDPTSLDVQRVIERVSHYVGRDPERPARLFALDRYYRAGFEAGVFTLAPRGLDQETTEREVSPFRFRLISVSRGGKEFLGDLEPEARSFENRAYFQYTPDITEHYEVLNLGVEQSWEIAKIPGEGDLVLRGEVSGMDLIGTDEAGLLFAPKEGIGLRYGTATVFDSAAKKAPVAVHPAPSEGGIALEIIVPEDFLQDAHWPIVIDPIIKANFPVSTAMGPQENPAIAKSSSNSLIVWEDSRSGSKDIYGARITAGGLILDPQGIPIATKLGTQQDPDVASDGTNFLVVWAEWEAHEIYGARINGGTGGVMDPSGVAIRSPGMTVYDDQFTPAVAWGGPNYLVVWHHIINVLGTSGGQEPGQSVRVSLVSAAASPLSFLTVSSVGSAFLLAPDVASNGTKFLVVWMDDHQDGIAWRTYAAQVSEAGVVLQPQGFPLVGGNIKYPPSSLCHQCDPQAASDGTNYFVVWTDRRISAKGVTDIYGTTVLQNGTVLGADGFPISTAPGNQRKPDIAWDGISRYAVVWSDQRPSTPGIYGTAVSTPFASLSHPNGLFLGTGAFTGTNPSIAVHKILFKSGTLPYWTVTWEKGSVNSSDIYAAVATP